MQKTCNRHARKINVNYIIGEAESRRGDEMEKIKCFGKEWEIIRVPTKYIHRNIELLPENVRSLKEERQKVRKVTGGYIPDTYSRYKS